MQGRWTVVLRSFALMLIMFVLAPRAFGYGGYVVASEPETGVVDAPKDDSGGSSTDHDDPHDDRSEDAQENPEPTSLVLGLLGLGITSFTYLRRRP